MRARIWTRLTTWIIGCALAAACVGAALAAEAPIELKAGADELDVTALTESWIDDSGDLDVKAVAEPATPLPWRASTAGTIHRLGEGALWQRLTVAPLPPGQHWFLQVSFNGADEVSLYYQNARGEWVAQQAGDHVAVEDWAIRDRTPVFALDSAPEARTYWLRIANWPVPVSAQLRLMREDRLTAWRTGGNLLLGAYFGLALLVIYIAALNVWQYRDRAFAWYGLYALNATMVQVCFTGIGGQFLWPASPWWNNAAPFIINMVSVATGAMLVREVCGMARLSHWLDRLILFWAAFGPLLGLGYVLWPSAAGFAVLTFFQISTVLLLIPIGAWCLRHGERWGLRLMLSFLPVLVTAPFPVLRNLGLLPAGFLTQYALAIGAALEIPWQLWLLSRRTRENHEADIRAHAMETLDPLTGLPPRSMLLFRLRDALRRARRDNRRCALLTVHLANHADILARHGREAADRALVLAGARLMRVARDVDTVSRIDLSQFAMLMEGPVQAPQVAAMATQVVAHGLNPSLKLPGGVTLRFHVTCMLAPEPQRADGDDAELCLQRLTHELARLAPDGRKAIVHLNY